MQAFDKLMDQQLQIVYLAHHKVKRDVLAKLQQRP
jgi:hypothetical protein